MRKVVPHDIKGYFLSMQELGTQTDLMGGGGWGQEQCYRISREEEEDRKNFWISELSIL